MWTVAPGCCRGLIGVCCAATAVAVKTSIAAKLFRMWSLAFDGGVLDSRT